MSNLQWETVTLGDVTTESRRRAGNDSGFKERPVYGVDRSVGLTSVAKYTASTLERYKILEHGMFAYNPMRLNIGSIGYCSHNIQPGLVSPDYVVFECNFEYLDPDFLSYYINSPYWKEWTANAGVGSVRMRIYYKELAGLNFRLPPLPEQHAIAEILGALDEKIELNRRMNSTLESIAQALFRRWFVENEDVSSWDISALPEIIDVNPIRSLKKGEIAPYLDMANMPTQGHRGIEWIDRPFGSGTKFINGDTLLARITPCLENGKTAFVDFLKDGQVGWGSTEYIVFRPKLPLPPEYGYYLVRGEELRRHAIINMTGTSGRQRTPASCFDNFMITVPPTQLAGEFGEFAKSVMEKIKINNEESRTLVSLRDNLLPKLIRGEFHVKDVEVQL
jgi:type I restriction enzyme S subunit